MVGRVLWRGAAAVCVGACALLMSATALASGPASSTAALGVVKLQREGASGAFTTSPIYALVGKVIEYQMQVTNTGDVPLAVTMIDPLCASGTLSGPLPTLPGNTLLPGGEVQYTCSHLLTGADASPFINTAIVVGLPPAAPAVVATASVRANKQAVGTITIARCARGHLRRTITRHGRKVAVCAARRRVRARRRTRGPAFTG